MSAPGPAMLRTLWRRDMMRLRRERSRWAGVLAQPLLFWLLLSLGFAESFQIPDAPELSFRTFFYPGILVMVVLFTTIFAMISLIEDRQSGFLQGVLVAPGSRLWLVLGKLLGVATIVGLQTLLFLLVLPAAGIAVGGVAWPQLLLLLVASTAALGAVNFIMAWRLHSSAAFHAVMSVVLLPLWVLSGALFPVPDGLFGALMLANPMTWMVVGLRAALLADNPLWAAEAALPLAALSVLAVGLVVLAARSARVR